MACPFCGAAVEVRVHSAPSAEVGGVAGRGVLRQSREGNGPAPVVVETREPVQLEQEASREVAALLNEVRAQAVARWRAVPPPRRRSLTPWEAAEHGRLAGLLDTVAAVLTTPIPFFRRLSAGSARAAFGFAAAVLGPVVLIQGLSVRLLLQHFGGASLPGLLPWLGTAAAGSAIAVVYLAAMYRLGTGVLSRRKMSFGVALRATAFGLAPLVLGWVPLVGLVVGLAWMLLVHGVAMRVLHGLGAVRAAAVVLLPLLPILFVLVGSWGAG